MSIEHVHTFDELDVGITERIYHPTVAHFYERFKREGIITSEMEFAHTLSADARDALLLTLGTHVHKEKPLFCFLIAKKYGLDQQKAAAIAVALDVLWMVSLMFDDLQDGDTERLGKPTMWAVYGKDKAYSIGTEILQSCLRFVEETCGKQVSDMVIEYVSKGVMANLSQTDFSLSSTTTEDLYASYDKRNDFSGVLGIDAVRIMSGVNGPSQSEYEELQRGMRLLNRGSQIVNDMKDLTNGYNRGFSDIRNGVVTVPIVLLYSSLSIQERSLFTSFFGLQRELNGEESSFIAAVLADHSILSSVISLIRSYYAQAYALLGKGFQSEDLPLLSSWISYKEEPLARYENS